MNYNLHLSCVPMLAIHIWNKYLCAIIEYLVRHCRDHGQTKYKFRSNFLLRNTSGSDLACCHCGTRLDVLAIRLNSSIVHCCRSYFWCNNNGHQELALVYPFSLQACSQGLGSLIGRASHRRCECVGLISTQVLRFFSWKENLGTCIHVLQKNMLLDHASYASKLR